MNVRQIVFIVIACILAFNFACVNGQEATKTGAISGQINTNASGTLPGAAILLKKTSVGVISDASGNFKLNNVPVGKQTVEVRFQGYKTTTVEVEVSENQVSTMNVTLEEEVYELNEVMVSTQKRDQLSIDVPVSISAVTSKTLAKLNLVDLDALSEYVPGLQVQLQSPNNPGFVIRGITSDDGDSRVQPRVSIYQDGVSISRSRGAAVELFDMERVEVVKGPQGTLFGRGAQIGAVHLIQNKPTDKVEASLKASYGNYNQKLITGYVNTPIIKGTLSNRLAFHYNERDGFIENISGGTLNGKKAYALRDVIRWTTGRSSVDLILNYQHDDYPGTAFKSIHYAPVGGDTLAWTKTDLEKGDSLGIKRNVGGATLHITSNLSDNWKFNSITAYRGFYTNELFDADGTASPALLFREVEQSTQLSQELRFNYDDKNKFSGFIGANYFYEDGYQYVPWYTNEQYFFMFLAYYAGLSPYPPVMSGVPLSTPYFALGANTIPLLSYHEEGYTNYGTTSAFELFGDGTYHITDNLSATFGIRGTYENLTGGYKGETSTQTSYLGMVTGLSPNVLFYPTNGQKISVNKDYMSYVGRFILNYKAGDNNVYAGLSKGRRPGVINISTGLNMAGTSTLDTTFLSPETVWSYEIGVKGKLLEGALTYSLSGYYYDWNHFQTNINKDLVTKTVDAGKAHSFGLEAESRYYFSKSSNIFASYSYIDAQFSDKDADGNTQEYSGNTFRLTPKHSMSAGLDLNFDFNQRKSSIYVRPSYTYKSKVYFEDNNTEELSQKGYGLANLTAGVVYRSKFIYQLGVFGKNVLDEKFIIDAGNTGAAFGDPTWIAGARATYGIELSVMF